MEQSIERVYLTVSGTTHALAPTEDPAEVKRSIVRAVRAGGDFVEVTVDGGQRLNFLIAAAIPVVITVESVTIATGVADRPAEAWSPNGGMTTEDDTPYDFI